MQRDASGLVAGNNLRGFERLRSFSLFFAQVEQLRTFAYIYRLPCEANNMCDGHAGTYVFDQDVPRVLISARA